MDWDNYRAFLEVYRSGDLGHAARESAMSVPTVRRRLDAVESEIGFTLFERTPRGLSPTPVARRLVQTIAAMAESAGAARALREVAAQEVMVASGEAIASNLLIPVWSKVRRSHATFAVNLLIRRRHSDLCATNADVILSHDRPADPGLTAHNCGSVEIGLFAHSDYIARAGVPATPADLERFNMIGSVSEGANGRLQASLDLPPGSVRHAFRTNSMVVYVGAIKAALGIGVFYVDVARRDASLVRVLPEAAGLLACWVWSPRTAGPDNAARPVFDTIVAALTERIGAVPEVAGRGDDGRMWSPIAA